MTAFKPGDIVKCIDSGNARLIFNKTYTITTSFVTHIGSSMVTVDGFVEEFFASRFAFVERKNALKRDAAVDVREEQCRAALTTTSDPFTCKKCGAPRATCTYH